MSDISISAFLQTQGVNLLKALLVLAAGLFLVHWFIRMVESKQEKLHIEPTLKGFLINLIKGGLYIVVILTAANVLGVPMTSIITLVASAGVAVTLAVQGALSNLVGGLILLILKPIRVGEYVKIGDHEGTVKAIGAFYTDLLTFDGRHISLPNGSLTNTPIINFTREGTRRLDVTFSVSYDADIDLVYRTLADMMNRNPALLPEPAPAVLLNEYAESSLRFVVRVWCRATDYWSIYFDLMDRGKRALDAAGIAIPYPQMDVHWKPERGTEAPKKPADAD